MRYWRSQLLFQFHLGTQTSLRVDPKWIIGAISIHTGSLNRDRLIRDLVNRVDPRGQPITTKMIERYSNAGAHCGRRLAEDLKLAQDIRLPRTERPANRVQAVTTQHMTWINITRPRNSVKALFSHGFPSRSAQMIAALNIKVYLLHFLFDGANEAHVS